MQFSVGHSSLLISASLIVAIMGAFTALRLTSNLRNISVASRKVRVSQGAIALGSSIWAMHFIAMLAITLPVAISYDPLRTLTSALLAVLVVGLAFMALHFGVRTKITILMAGILTGFGISGMHYLGMSAISGNVAITFSTFGVVLATLVGIVASIAALELAYGDRSILSIAFGSVVLGLAISGMHHTAMHYTAFFESSVDVGITNSLLDKETLALIVVIASFVLCGSFLLSAVPSEGDAAVQEGQKPTTTADRINSNLMVKSSDAPVSPVDDGIDKIRSIMIPYEQNSVVKYLSAHSIHAVKADGHYTSIYNGSDKLFCPWSISQMQERLDSSQFIRTHRSFLVNKRSIVGIKRSGDKTFCVVGKDDEIEIPIARQQVGEMKKLLQTG